MSEFTPPLLLRNSHLQTILASAGPRKSRVKQFAQRVLTLSTVETIVAADGSRAGGLYARHPNNTRGLAILIHGWEGSASSPCVVSAAQQLFDLGYSVFRLNLPDHGYTHELNEYLFNATRLQEIAGIVTRIQQTYTYPDYSLIGYSLGGNFALRLGLVAESHGLSLQKIVAICPVIDPVQTFLRVEQGIRLYHDELTRRYRQTLRRKLEAFPHLDEGGEVTGLKTLREMNDYLVEQHSTFDSTDEYLAAYGLRHQALEPLAIPAHILFSGDDPMVSERDLGTFSPPDNVTVEVTRYGGHCGFLDSWSMTSWVDKRLDEWLTVR